MRCIAIALGLCLCLSTFGQQNVVGFTGGPSLSRWHGNDVFKQTDPKTGFQFSGGYTHWFKKGLGIQGQLNYSRMGCELDFIGFDAQGLETIRDKIVYRFEHLGVSLGAAYRTPGRVHALVGIGVMPATIVVGEVNAPSLLRPEERTTLDLTAKAKNPVLFGYGAFGGGVDLTTPITIGLLMRYDHGLSTLSRNDFFENENIIETSWSLSLTVAYRWPKAD